MPVYEFHCKSHGTFDALRPMAAFADPCCDSRDKVGHGSGRMF
jgi:putative FmdB family regulatory protein